jgi:hypothetical protein
VTKSNLLQVSMVITKASLQPDGSMRWQAVTSDTSPDNTGEATSLALFQDWIQRAETGVTVDWLPEPRKPFLGVSHYSDLEGFGEAGITKEMWIQGDRFKAGGTFRSETPIGPALFEAVRGEAELARKGAVDQPIRISAAWWDIEHSHGPFIFTRKSLTDVCPMCAKGEGNKVYLKGQLDHFAATRVPINPRTSLALQEKSEMGTTRKQDAATIIDEDLAEELEEKSKLVGKSETEQAIVIKAKGKPKMEEEETAEEYEETEEEEAEEEAPKGKKKPKGGSFLSARAYTWAEAKALPVAKSMSRFELVALVRRNAAELPEVERLGALEALIDDVETEMQEIRQQVEELYFSQPAVEDELLFDGEEETTPMSTDYLEEFADAVRKSRTVAGTEQKAALMQEALSKVATAMKAELEPKPEPGDMVSAFKAAIGPLADQIAQLNARLNMSQQQPAVVVPVQKSVTVPSVAPVQQPQNQLPISPVTGQPSSITAAVRNTTIY